MKQSVFIKTLEFGEKAGLDGTTWPRFKKWAIDNRFLEPKNNNGQDKTTLKEIFTAYFKETQTTAQGQVRYILKPEYGFKLFEYRELKAAKISADKRTHKTVIFASLAILISVAVGIVSMFKPNSINPEAFTALIESCKSKETQKLELSRLQMAQILSAIEGNRRQPARRPVMQNPSDEDSMLDAINRYYEQ